MLMVGREVSSLTMKCKSTQLAPIARVGTDSERELVMARWGMPGPPQSLVQGGMDQDRAGFSADIAAISRQCTAAAGQQKVIAAEARVAIVLHGIEKIARIA